MKTVVLLLPINNLYISSETDKEGQTKIYKQMTVHKNSQDEDVVFDMDEESDGSIRLLDFIPMLIDLQFNSAVYLIDEIDRSMHPIMSQKDI